MLRSHVVLVAHASPQIHGQAVAAAALIEESRSWNDIQLHHVNAVYAENRSELSRFSFEKVLRLFRYLYSAVRLIHRHRAGVVIVTPAFFRGPFLKDAFMIAVLKFLTRAKIVGWVHMDPSRIEMDSAPGWLRGLIQLTVSRVDAWVACSPALVAGWPDFLPKSKCTGLANGIGAPDFTVQNSTNAPIRVVYLSAMHSEKGWVEALTSARSLCGRHPKIEFHFHGNAGSKAEEAQIDQEFSQGPYPERIRWLGPAWGEEKWRVLVAADLFCFPSHTEQFPIAVLDAMASGLAVVSTQVGAVEDAIQPDKGGWLVSPRDAGALEQALEQALSDPSRLKVYGAFNRRRYEELFTQTAFGQRWEHYLSMLLFPS